ncbi:MAG TPA: hypothetical protein VN709_05095 [Terriglobales bacterium]|nr:hypothetical protein [Terriglobales bacterium]
MRPFVIFTALFAIGLSIAAGAQTAPCRVAIDALAPRRSALQQALAGVNAENIAAKKQQAATDTDTMVLVGNYYAASHQLDEAARWWNQAAQSGNPLGFEALAVQSSGDLGARRRAYAQAAQHVDPEAERAYGAMLLKGEGGPRLQVLGREFLIKAAQDGSDAALVAVGGALVGLPDAEFANAFQPIKDAALGNCYLTAAASHDSLGARRALRQAYDANLLTDPQPTPRLSDTNAFMSYLQSYEPARQPEVLSQAIARDPNGPNTRRAREELVWLEPPPTPGAAASPALQILLAQDPHNATALYFSLLADLPLIPHDASRNGAATLHTDATVTLGAKLTEQGIAGLADLENPGMSLGLDQDVYQRRLVSVKRAFQEAADLAQPVAAGRLWTHPQTADDVVADYIYQRGGLDKLTGIAAAHLLVKVTARNHGKDDQDWQRELWVAQDFGRYSYSKPSDSSSHSSDDFTPPPLDPDTVEAIVSNGHGWAMKNDYGPTGWTPDIPPHKRDNHAPAEFGPLHAPWAGDLDGPLVDYARRRAANNNPPAIELVGKEGNEYHLRIAAVGDSAPAYDAYVDAGNYQLSRLMWSWEMDDKGNPKDTQIVDYSDFSRQYGILVPRIARLTSYTGNHADDPSNQNVETDQIASFEINRQWDPSLFTLTRNEAGKFKQALEKAADDKKKRDKGN